jgi:hypothetical protein
VTNTSSIYGSVTLSSAHAIEGSTKRLQGGSHGKPEVHLVAAPPHVRNGSARGQSSPPRPLDSFSVSVASGGPKGPQPTGFNWEGAVTLRFPHR